MSRIAYVNGRYLAHARAQVHIEDRGFQFADGVYEVCEVFKGGLVDLTRHLNRLERSLGEIAINMPVHRAALKFVMAEVVRRNRVRNGLVYVQVTRGVAPRNHVFPPPDTPSSLVVTARSVPAEFNEIRSRNGLKIVTMPETRWARVDIKSTGLLPNVLARQFAREQGADEAWFVDTEGFVTEGAATTAWIITASGTLVTRPNGTGILPGVTRMTVSDLISDKGLTLQERAFTVAEAVAAQEVFVTAASTLVMPVVAIDEHAISGGKPGEIVISLLTKFHDSAEIV